MLKNCNYCGKQIRVYKSQIERGRGKYCSHSCSQKNKANPKFIDCEICGKKLRFRPHGKRGYSKCCSRECGFIYRGSMKGPKNPSWKGGKILKSGYVCVHSPDHPFKMKSNYVMEHRVILEKHLGYFLDPKLDVHHINGIRYDNRLKNLMVVSRSEHKKIHFKLKKEKNNEDSCNRE